MASLDLAKQSLNYDQIAKYLKRLPVASYNDQTPKIGLDNYKIAVSRGTRCLLGWSIFGSRRGVFSEQSSCNYHVITSMNTVTIKQLSSFF